jgi:hypothetical protein
MKDVIVTKLMSRKLWIAVAGIVGGVVLIAKGNVVEGTATIISSVVGYLLAEGFIDASAVNKVTDAVEEVVDNTKE